MGFDNRRDAGRRLAERLLPWRAEAPVVVGLPRGGVPVAAEVARALEAPLDVLVVRKLGCPWQPELGIGAIGEEGIRLVNEDLVARLAITPEQLEQIARREEAEVNRRIGRYRGQRPPVPVEGRAVILVDDGLATGFTARAGVEILRRRGARRVIVGVPVAPPQTVEELRAVADELVVLSMPEWFPAIGAFYADFTQTTDEEVTKLLAAGAPAISPGRRAVPADPAREVLVPGDGVALPGILSLPDSSLGLVLFAHGSGSSRLSPRNLTVAAALNRGGLGTLLFDLLSPAEERDRANVFDIELLSRRLVEATRWLRRQPDIGGLPLGYFGASTGAAAALMAAADLPEEVSAVVSRGGRPDLAAPRLEGLRAPTLLIVGGRDVGVLQLNREALRRMTCVGRLEVVPEATHLFDEPGALEAVSALARDWFREHLFEGESAGHAPPGSA